MTDRSQPSNALFYVVVILIVAAIATWVALFPFEALVSTAGSGASTAQRR